MATSGDHVLLFHRNVLPRLPLHGMIRRTGPVAVKRLSLPSPGLSCSAERLFCFFEVGDVVVVEQIKSYYRIKS
jgi:hypothetical protein